MRTDRCKAILHMLLPLFVVLAALPGGALSVTRARAAATITVDGSADDALANLAGNGLCDLREALEAANTDAIVDACGAGSGADTIRFDASLAGATIYLAATLNILQPASIDGSSLASRVTISGDNNVRVFAVGGGVTATLNSLIVTQGRLNTDGGAGLVNNGTLTVSNSVFSAHAADNQYGGAILNNSAGNLTITGSTFANNSAFSGGAIANYNQLTVKSSTFIDNGGASTDAGGAIYASGSSITLAQSITNSTFSGNSANIGGAIWSSRTQTITNSTFSGNVAYYPNSGGAVWQDDELLNYANTIMANSTGGDCNIVSSGNIGTNINNLVEQTNYCGPAVSVDPKLGTLANNGGPTQTFALLANSPAIDAGDDATCAASPISNLDQRGVARPNGGHCDIGAYEYIDTTAPSVTAFIVPSPATSLSIPITTFTVQEDAILTGYLITESATPPSLGEAGWMASAPSTYSVSSYGTYTLYPWAKDAAGHVSAVFGTPRTVLVCDDDPVVTSAADSGTGTLRQAIPDACAGGTITFASALSGATIHLSSTLNITKDVTIDGSALASRITLSGDSDNNGAGDVRVLHVADDVLLDVTLDSLTIAKGQSNEGGAIFNGAYLTIKNSTITNNSSTGYAGAISSYRPLTIIDSTFTGNSSTGSGNGGGAILNSSTLTIRGSTFSGNTADSASGTGGALYTTSPNTAISNSTFAGNAAGTAGAIMTTNNLAITNSTISGNAAPLVGGLLVEGGTTNLINTIIANSSFGVDCTNNAIIGANTNNLIEDGSCGPSVSGDPQLGALADNGGPTHTMALLPGSPAINAGDDSACAASPVSDRDQRGLTRSGNGVHCDIGAYEYQDSIAPTVASILRADPSPSRLGRVRFTVTFSEPVTGVDATDFALTTVLTGTAIADIGGAGTTYTVTVKTGLGNGSIRLDIPDGTTIADVGGNLLAGLPYTGGGVYIMRERTVYLPLVRLP